MTPAEAIEKLKTLPEDKQRAVLTRLSPDERKGIMTQLQAPPSVQTVPGAVPGMAEPNKPAAPPDLERVASPVTALREFGSGFVHTIPSMIAHPQQTLSSMGQSVTASGLAPEGYPATAPLGGSDPGIGGQHAVQNEAQAGQAEAARAIQENPAKAAGGLASNVVAAELLGMAPRVGTALRTTAIGDPDVAALKGLRVPAGSPKSLRTLSATEGSRPFLKGATDLADIQTKMPAAKSEVWGKYQKTVDQIRDKPAKGPDGMTTVGELEAERKQLSALNRDLKAKDPQAIQTAQQKGMNQAQLLDREKAVQAALDPHLEAAGIDPKLIRQTFGQLSTVEGRIAGRSTLAEPKQPYGFSRLGDVSLTKPFSNIPLAGGIAKDIAAGRYFSAKPTDVAIREAFRGGGPKPDFRAPVSSMPPFENKPLALPSSTIPNAGYGEDFTQGGFPGSARNFNAGGREGPSAPPIIPQQRGLKQLPASTTPSTTQPMIQTLKPVEPPADTSAPIYPPGSQFRGVQETPFYPAASQFRKPIGGQFDLDEYLRQNP